MIFKRVFALYCAFRGNECKPGKRRVFHAAEPAYWSPGCRTLKAYRQGSGCGQSVAQCAVLQMPNAATEEQGMVGASSTWSHWLTL
jgi:hypothetical protein